MTRRDTDDHEVDPAPADIHDEQEQVPLPTIFCDPADVRAAAELAEAERAGARHTTSPAQATGLAAARERRRAEDRVAEWRTATND